MVAPTLNVEEYQYSDTGLVLNQQTVSVPFVDITSVSGLDAAPVRLTTMDRDGFDGGYVESEFETIRTVVLEGNIYADPANMETYLDQLKANFAPDNVNKPFYFQTDAGQRMVMGKAQGIRYDKDSLRRVGAAAAQIQVMCEDPRIYTPGLQNATVQLSAGTASGGRGYPKSYSFGYGTPVTQSGLDLVLSGNRTTPAVIRVDGAIVNPVIIYDNTGAQMSFNVSLNAGDYLTVDLSNKSVLLNGGLSIRNLMTLTGKWFMLAPGDNYFRLLGTQQPATPVAQLTVSAYSAWR